MNKEELENQTHHIIQLIDLFEPEGVHGYTSRELRDKAHKGSSTTDDKLARLLKEGRIKYVYRMKKNCKTKIYFLPTPENLEYFGEPEPKENNE